MDVDDRQYILISYFYEDPEAEDPVNEVKSDPMSYEAARDIFMKTSQRDLPEDDEDHYVDIEHGVSETEDLRIVAVEQFEKDLCEENEDGTFDIDDLISNMSDERMMVAFRRAEKEFGGVVADYESEEFTAEYHDHLKRLVAEDFVANMREQGLVEARVNKDGEHEFFPTPLGEKAIDELRQPA